MKTPLTKARLRTHLTYNLWKYALLIILAVLGWNLIYTTTAYRPPAEKKVNVYISSSTGNQTDLDLYLETIRLNEMPDMEDVSSVMLATSSGDYYAAMQLSTYMAAGEGDIYLLPKADFVNYATGGAFLPLEGYAESGELNTRDIDVSSGWRKYSDDEITETHLYGIPAASLTGFQEYSVTCDGYYLCVLAANGNDENTLKLLSILLRDMSADASPATPTDLATATDAVAP